MYFAKNRHGKNLKNRNKQTNINVTKYVFQYTRRSHNTTVSCQQERQYTYKVTLRRFREIIVAMEKQ